jgi:S-adenosylmethionine:tRNA ribosyltransferase-isomerase
MKISEFDYHLPKPAIAQHPLQERDRSRLLVINRATGEFEDRHFIDLPEYLSAGDALVVNNCRVIPGRIFARRKTGARLEITLLKKTAGREWECLVKGKQPKPGELIDLGQGLNLVFKSEKPLDQAGGWLGGLWLIAFSADENAFLEKTGVAPLPPYIKRNAPEDYAPDRARYQTIFASREKAVAAPTAGLHFTEKVLQKIRDKGIELLEITLEVSYGTFAPVRVERIEDHKMFAEKFQVSEQAASGINRARAMGKKVVAVGTTVARTLEAASDGSGRILAQEAETDLFIFPGYRFKAVDALLTNFHMPRSTLLMLVSAFAGTGLIKKAYEHALDAGYRFLSYGDCMLLI